MIVRENIESVLKPKEFENDQKKFFDVIKELKSLGITKGTFSVSKDNKKFKYFLYVDIINENDPLGDIPIKTQMVLLEYNGNLWSIFPGNISELISTPNWKEARYKLLEYLYPNINAEINLISNKLNGLNNIKKILNEG